jgi:HD-like signal output (HDOD) protein
MQEEQRQAPRILLVDDDRNTVDSLLAVLRRQRREWQSSSETEPMEALRRIREEPFDIVVADMRMPEVTGAELLKEVERLQPGAIRVILSGYSEMSMLLKSVKHAHQFLAKPCPSAKLLSTLERVLDLAHILTNEPLRSMVARLDSLPVLPELYLEIVRKLGEPDPSIAEIGTLVQRDVGMTASLMKIVNSSFFGFCERVSKPERAITLLGLDVLKGLILGVHFFKEIDPALLRGCSIGNLWDHSMGAGQFARIIAEKEGRSVVFSQQCFLAGILHDVGKLVLLQEMREQYAQVLDTAREQGGPIHPLEKQLLGIAHAEIGAYLLGLWGFEADVVQGVYGHHEPLGQEQGLTVPLAVHAANVFQHELAHADSENVFSSLDEPRLERSGLLCRAEIWREACEKGLEQT